MNGALLICLPCDTISNSRKGNKDHPSENGADHDEQSLQIQRSTRMRFRGCGKWIRWPCVIPNSRSRPTIKTSSETNPSAFQSFGVRSHPEKPTRPTLSMGASSVWKISTTRKAHKPNRGTHGDSPLILSQLRLLSGKPPPLCKA